MTKRLSHGYSFQASYLWSSNINRTTRENEFDDSLVWAPSNNSAPHNLNAKLLLGDSLMRIGDIPDASRSELERTEAFEKAAAQYRDVLKAWTKNPSATSPATSVMPVPTPARNTRGGPHS